MFDVPFCCGGLIHNAGRYVPVLATLTIEVLLFILYSTTVVVYKYFIYTLLMYEYYIYKVLISKYYSCSINLSMYAYATVQQNFCIQ